LSDDNRTELKNMIDLCDKIHQAADTFMSMGAADKDKQWAAVISDAARIVGRANDMLNFISAPTYTSAYPYGTGPGQYIPPQQGITPLQPGQTIILPPQQMLPTTNPTAAPVITPTPTPTPIPVVTPSPAPPPARSRPPRNSN
jgi:hypothetical protein